MFTLKKLFKIITSIFNHYNLVQNAFADMISYRVITTRKRSLGQGNIFTPVCHSVHGGGGLSASVRAGILPTPPDHAPAPPETMHPRRTACWEIRSTRGRYASYWNAILFEFEFNNRLGLRKYKAVHSGLYSH